METVIMALSRNAWGQTKKSDLFKRGLLILADPHP